MTAKFWYPKVIHVPHLDDQPEPVEGCLIAIPLGPEWREGMLAPSIEGIVHALGVEGFVITGDETHVMSPDRVYLGHGLTAVLSDEQ